MTENEKFECAIHCAKYQAEIEVCEDCKAYNMDSSTCKEIAMEAIKSLEEVQEYRKIGTVEELKKSVKEENVLKFYYCESEDDYYTGKYMGNMYYAKYGEAGFVWFMSRYLPWGEHVVAPHTLWKEYTYPSEPKEIPFDKWIQGFLKKYCGGSPEECREAVEKTKSKKAVEILGTYGEIYECPECGSGLTDMDLYAGHCKWCGQKVRKND